MRDYLEKMSAESDLALLLTEQRNPHSEEIDALPTAEMLRVINDEDATIAARVADEIPRIAQAVDSIYERVQKGGRLFYIGAGTSGRLGVLDASECPPTFSVARNLVQGIIAGGDAALRVSAEGAEDSREQGALDLLAHGFNEAAGNPAAGLDTAGHDTAGHDTANLDTLVGVAASGRTPYVLGAVEHARRQGCLTVGLSCVPGSALARACQIAITPAVGPEVITGSTRMKAGTATKLVLNMLSTGLMVRLGHVYGNLMTNVAPTNAKLVDRAERIIQQATGVKQVTSVDRQRAAELLQQGGSVKVAIVMGKRGVDRRGAEDLLTEAGGVLRRALGESSSPDRR